MSKTQPTQTTQTQSVPAWIEEASRTNIDSANNLPAFQPYTGLLVAPQSQAQNDARDVIYRNYNRSATIARDAIPGLNEAGAYQPMMISTPELGGQAVNVDDIVARMIRASDVTGDINTYMNPFTQSVIDNTVNTLDRSRVQTQAGNAAAAAKAGAFGGSRHGVVEGETNRGFADAAATATGNLNMQGFTQALQAALTGATANQNAALTADRSNQATQLETGRINTSRDLAEMEAGLRAALGNQTASSDAARTRLQGALGLNSVAETVNASNAADVQGLLTIGALDQGNQQQGLDKLYQEFMRAQEDPYRRLNASIAATGGSRGTTSTTTSGMSHTNLLGPALGLGLTLATGGTFGLPGLLAGGMGSALGAGAMGGGIGGSSYSIGYGGTNMPVYY